MGHNPLALRNFWWLLWLQPRSGRSTHHKTQSLQKNNSMPLKTPSISNTRNQCRLRLVGMCFAKKLMNSWKQKLLILETLRMNSHDSCPLQDTNDFKPKLCQLTQLEFCTPIILNHSFQDKIPIVFNEAQSRHHRIVRRATKDNVGYVLTRPRSSSLLWPHPSYRQSLKDGIETTKSISWSPTRIPKIQKWCFCPLYATWNVACFPNNCFWDIAPIPDRLPVRFTWQRPKKGVFFYGFQWLLMLEKCFRIPTCIKNDQHHTLKHTGKDRIVDSRNISPWMYSNTSCCVFFQTWDTPMW